MLHLVLIIFFSLLSFYNTILAIPFSFDVKTSSLKVSSTGNLIIGKAITGFNGTLIRDTSGVISGNTITFTHGVFEDAGNELSLTSVFNPTGQLLLSGNNSIRSEPGEILQSISVSGTNNTLSGQPSFSSDIVLQNSSASLNVALQSAANANIQLNGGTVTLNDNLAFVNQKIIAGTGTVSGGNGYTLATGDTPFTWTENIAFNSNANLELYTDVTLNGNLTFTGISTLNGHGNLLDLGSGGTITVTSGSTLYLTDVMLRGLGGGGNLVLNSGTSTVIMTNVTLELSGNVSTPQGIIDVQGPSTWILKSNNWNFGSAGMLTVNGVTLFKDQAGAGTLGSLQFTSSGQLSLLNEGRICDVVCSTSLILSRIEVLETCCDLLTSEVDVLISEVDVIKSEIDVIDSEIDVIDSEIDVLGTCCDDLKTSTGFLQSEIDTLETCCDLLTSEVDVIKSEIDVIDSEIDVLGTCCDDLKTSTGFLQSEIDALETCCDLLTSEVDVINSEIDVINSEIEVLASCCDSIKTDTTLESRIEVLETCCDLLTSEVDIINSEIDVINSEIDVLVSCCDSIKTDTTLESRIEVLETCCDLLTSEVDVINSEIDIINSEIDGLESCCDLLTSEVDVINSEIDVLISIIDTIDTSTSGALSSQVDVLCKLIGCECTILVTNTLLFKLNMLPAANETTIFKFDPCFAPCSQKPVLLFDPAVYGNDGEVTLPAGSRVIFTGDGIVELRNGVEFDMQGTPVCLGVDISENPGADWPCLIIEDGATMHLDLQAVAAIGGGTSTNVSGPGGAGRVIVRRAGRILLDQESQLIFGNRYLDDIEVSAEFVGSIITNAPRALITFQKSCFSLEFNHQSSLSILQGAVEMNMFRGAFTDLNGNEATAIINKLHFDEGSLLYVLRRGTDVGLLRMAPNFNPSPNFALGADVPMDFNNKCGQVCGGGYMQFKEFAGITVPIDQHFFEQGAVIAAGSVIPLDTIFPGQTLFQAFELTADTLIPAGSILAAGSVIGGVPIVAPLPVITDTVFARGTYLAAGSTVAAYAIETRPLTSAILVPPRSRVPAGTVISPSSERVNTVVNLQPNNFDLIATPVNIFMELSYLVPNEPTPDGTILMNLGSLEPSQDGRLGAFCPPARNGIQRDGSIVGLQPGDHDLQYNASSGSPFLNQITGFTFSGQQFVISNCDEGTRTVS